jgi:HAMP domain-containing protein
MAAATDLYSSSLAVLLTFGYCLVMCGAVAFACWSLLTRRFLAASLMGGAVVWLSGWIWSERRYGESWMGSALRLTFEALGLERPMASPYVLPMTFHGVEVAEAVVVAFLSALGLALALVICFYQSYRYRKLEELARQVNLGDADYRLHRQPAPKAHMADAPGPTSRELAVMEPGVSLEDRVGMQLYFQREQRARETAPIEVPRKYRPRFSPPLSRASQKAS